MSGPQKLPAVGAELICVSMNFWYRAHGMGPIFPKPSATHVFLETYELLDPGCCVVAEQTTTRRLMGGCFYHPRETHVSLGIMNVHPDYFRRGVASALLTEVTASRGVREHVMQRVVCDSSCDE